VWAAATGKVRLPTVASLTGGATRRFIYIHSEHKLNKIRPKLVLLKQRLTEFVIVTN